MGVSGQHHAPAALYPRGKDPRYPLDRRLGGPQSRSGPRGKILCFCRGSKPGRPIRSQTLYCLSHRGSWKFITIFKRPIYWSLLSHINHTFTSYLFNIHFNIIIPSTPSLHKFSSLPCTLHVLLISISLI
jgi:hypothetical protein